MKNIVTYLIISLLFKQKVQLCKGYKNAVIFPQPHQYFGLYDYFQKRFENLQNNNLNPLRIDHYKRSLNGEYVALYDEFKRRLDNFNAAFLVAMEIPNCEVKKPFLNVISNNQLKSHTFENRGKNEPLQKKIAHKKPGMHFKTRHKQKNKAKISKIGKNNFRHDTRRFKLTKGNQNVRDALKSI